MFTVLLPTLLKQPRVLLTGALFGWPLAICLLAVLLNWQPQNWDIKMSHDSWQLTCLLAYMVSFIGMGAWVMWAIASCCDFLDKEK
jgi:hypothetical protein